MAISWSSLALRYGLVLVAIILFALLPALLAIGSSIFADSLGCQVDEGSSHPCLFMDSDIGDTLNFMFVMGWFALMTLPAGAAALFAWATILTVHVIIRLLKRTT
jgi:hypothetical protein